MYSPIQLDIIRTFGSKELSEGCLIQESKRLLRIAYETWIKNAPYFCIDLTEIQWSPQCGFNPKDYENAEILWHIPELFPDVARVAKEKDWIIKIEYNYFKREYVWITIDNTFWEDDIYALIPYNPTLSLLDQDEQTLASLLNLFNP